MQSDQDGEEVRPQAIMKLIVVHPRSRHGVLSQMAVALQAALQREGHDALLIDAAADEDAFRGQVQAGNVEAVVSFGSYLAELRLPDGRSLYDASDCAFIGWDVDHPFFQYDRFAAPLIRRIAVCASPAHLRAGRRIGRFGAELLALPGAPGPTDRPAPLHARPYAAVMALSAHPDPEVFWASAAGTPAHALVEGFVERLFADEGGDVLRAFEGSRDALGLEVRLDPNVCDLICRGALFVRRTQNLRLIEVLRKADPPVLVIGAGWEERLSGARRISVRQDMSFEDLQSAYGQARTVINLNAANGASERAVGALAAGALVLTEDAPVLSAAFGSSGALCIFSLTRPETIIASLEAAAERADAQDAADAGQAMVASAHLWSHKARILSDAVSRL